MGKDIHINRSLILCCHLCATVTSKSVVFSIVYLCIWILCIWVWLYFGVRNGQLSEIWRVGKSVILGRSREGNTNLTYLVRFFCYAIKLFSWRFIFSLVINSKDRFSCHVGALENVNWTIEGRDSIRLDSRLCVDMKHYGLSTDVNKHLLLLLRQNGVDLGVTCSG